MKFKFNDNTMTYTLKGLHSHEVAVLLALVSNVRLGQSEPSEVALDFMTAWEKLEGDLSDMTEGIDVRVSFEDINPKLFHKDPIIEIRYEGEFDEPTEEKWPFRTGIRGCGSCADCDCSGK